MSGVMASLPNTPSWRGARLKKSTGTTLPLPKRHPVMAYRGHGGCTDTFRNLSCELHESVVFSPLGETHRYIRILYI